MNFMRLWQAIYPFLRWVAVAAVIFMFWQALPMDAIAFAIAGDMVTYLEIATAAWLMAHVTRARWAVAYVRTTVRRSYRRGRARGRRTLRRIARLARPSSDDDRPGPALAFAWS